MMVFVTAIGLLVAWCGAVLYVRFRPARSQPRFPSDLALDEAAPVAAPATPRGRYYNAVTYGAPVVVGLIVAVACIVIMAPLLHG